ncbi:MAG: histidine kinase [Acidaminococcaceae bacterium]|nr:histidine kinase [Acidaminococcaceae bacterium]
MLELSILDSARVEIQQLWLGTSLFLVIIMLLSKMRFFNTALVEKNYTTKNKLILIAIFSVIGILGTYWGIRTQYGIINTRAVGVVVGGLLGGPVVGSAIGTIVGVHRIFAPITLSSFESGMITIIQGILAGFLSNWFKQQKKMWPYAFALGFLFEALHMVLLLLFAKPYAHAVSLVKAIAPSMLLTNPVATALFVGVIEDNYRRQERYKAEAAQTSFRTMNLVINVLQEGYNPKTIRSIVDIVLESTAGVSWAAILAPGKIVALSCADGLEQDKIRQYINKKNYYYGSTIEKNILGSYNTAIFPVYKDSDNRQLLVISKDINEDFSNFEMELFRGLCSLLQIQLEINTLKEQAVLLSEAEVKVLQAQINPHFLFNALNTISYYCRSNPEKAKDLIIYLAEYYRHSLNNESVFINFKQEIRHIQAYVNIEMARFGDRLKINYNIPEFLDFNLPCLILQPLVENAIKHGVLPRESGGTVEIGAAPHGQNVRLYVYDNGVGIPKEKLSRLLLEDEPAATDGDEAEQRKSVGLQNVHKRLLAYYGEKSGLQITSSENAWTMVFFEIPLTRS